MSAENPLISVIVPVYKVEQYMDECIESVLAQTYRRFELILVDDGSPDKCGEKCDCAAKTDERIKVIHKSNGGLSDARNAGFKASIGEYVTYVDSDDVIAPTYLEVMINAAQRYDADIVQVDYTKHMDKFGIKTAEDTVIRSCGATLENLLLRLDFQEASCVKLYRRDIAEKVEFPKGRLYEDTLTAYQFAFYTRTFVACHSNLYYYRVNPLGIMHKPLSEQRLSLFSVFDEMREFFSKNAAWAEREGIDLPRVLSDALYYEFRIRMFVYNECLVAHGEQILPKQMKALRDNLISRRYDNVPLEMKYRILRRVLKLSSSVYKLLIFGLRPRPE